MSLMTNVNKQWMYSNFEGVFVNSAKCYDTIVSLMEVSICSIRYSTVK